MVSFWVMQVGLADRRTIRAVLRRMHGTISNPTEELYQGKWLPGEIGVVEYTRSGS